MEKYSQRRDRQEMVFAVLREIKGGEKMPTRIAKASNLCWQPFRQILETLLSDGFITEGIDGRRKTYHITEEGERALVAYFDAKSIMTVKKFSWILDLLELEQSEEWRITLGALVRTSEPFTINSIYHRLNLVMGKGKFSKFTGELKGKAIVTEYKIPLPENWDSLSAGVRARRAREMRLPRGWHLGNYLVFDREKFKELIFESVKNRIEIMLT